MAKVYRDTHLINEKADELIKELELFRHYIHGQIEYQEYMANASMEADVMTRYGETDRGAISLTDDEEQQIQRDVESYIDSEYPELGLISDLIPLLKKLSASD